MIYILSNFLYKDNFKFRYDPNIYLTSYEAEQSVLKQTKINVEKSAVEEKMDQKGDSDATNLTKPIIQEDQNGIKATELLAIRSVIDFFLN